MKNAQSSLLDFQQIYDNMISEYEDFEKNTNSLRHAINFALLAYHFREWVWYTKLKENSNLKKNISPSLETKHNFNAYVISKCPFFKNLREFANYSKHCIIADMKSLKGFSSSPNWDEINCTWENAAFTWDYSGLIIITKKDEWISLLDGFEGVKTFWVNFVNEHSLLKTK